ncbi:MAG: outer membrane beta-barrel protein [Kiritimatiellae bacterium]|nr:outer membrane beta-barrel protein [Kiritimatiellia bacterium]
MRIHSFSAVSMAALAGVALAPAAFAVGNNVLGLSARVGVSYTDNRDQVENGTVRAGRTIGKEDQWSFYIGPTVSLKKHVDDRLDFEFGYSPVIRWYDEATAGKEKHKVDHSVYAKLDYDFSPRTRVRLTESYWWTGMRDYFYGEGYEFDPNRDTKLDHEYWENRVGGSISHKLVGEDYLKLSANWRVKRYDDDELAAYSDEDEYSARADYMHSATRFVSYGLFASYLDWDRESDASRTGAYRIDQGVSIFTLGLQGIYDFDGNRNHYLYAGVGWSRDDYEADDLDSEDFASVVAELRLFQQKETSLNAGFRYGTYHADTYPFSAQEETAGYVTVTERFSDRFRANAALEFRRRTYDGSDDLDPTAARYGYLAALKEANGGSNSFDKDSTFFRVTLAYDFNEWVTGNAWYSFQKVDSDVGQDYDENRCGLGATVKFY